jgi:hypothetical protein
LGQLGQAPIPHYDFTPTGEMAIEIVGWSRFEDAQHRFADTRARMSDKNQGQGLRPATSCFAPSCLHATVRLPNAGPTRTETQNDAVREREFV